MAPAPRAHTLTEELHFSPMRVLLISSEDQDLRLVSETLQDSRVGHFLLEAVDEGGRGLTRMTRNSHDVCLLTHEIRPESGLVLLEQAMAEGCDLPVVMISATHDYELDMAAMRHGAADYLPREELNAVTLERTIRYAINHKKMQRQLRELAVRDPLTGLCNRRGFVDRLQRGMARATRSSSLLALLILDLDGFKSINDRFGHQAGDDAIRQVGQRLVEAVRQTDAVCRIGGDELAIIVEGLSERTDATRITEGVVSRVAEPMVVAGQPVRLTASVGVAFYPDDDASVDRLLRLADSAMYQAKRLGGGRHLTHRELRRRESAGRLAHHRRR